MANNDLVTVKFSILQLDLIEYSLPDIEKLERLRASTPPQLNHKPHGRSVTLSIANIGAFRQEMSDILVRIDAVRNQ